MAANALTAQLLNGLTIGMVYVLLAAGLSIIFGVMDVINFTHGEFFALGAYFAVSIAVVGGGMGFWVALVVAPLLVAVLGAGIERLTIRPLYGRNPLYHILLTFGLVLIAKDVIDVVWGTQPKSFNPPPILSGPIEVFGFTYSLYNYFVIAAGVVIAVGTWLALTRTRAGVIVRAGAQDREMVRHLGIDIDRYYTLVFAFGALLAAVAGIVLGAKQSVTPTMGDAVIIPAFVIVVLGGLGSFRGAVLGGLLVGIIQTAARSYAPQLEGLVVFLLMIGVLLVRPQGLFGNPEWQSNETGGDLLTGGGVSVLPDDLRRNLAYGLVGLLAIAPFLGDVVVSSYYINTLLVHMLVWALFALSLDLVMGYTGLVSLGHVLFYGLGAYATVLTVVYLTPNFWVALAVGILVAAVVAWVVGYLSIRVSGVYFSMITLGFAELFFQAVFKFGFTGGSDGLFSAYDPTYFPGQVVGDVTLVPGTEVQLFYYLVLVAAVGVYLLARRVMDAPFGGVLQSIRESEERSQFLGYDTTAYKRNAFTISGGIAGLAGGLATVSTGGVAPSFLHWVKSGEVIVMTILGGMGTLYGPMLGAGVYYGLKEVLLILGDLFAGTPLSLLFEQWQGILGVVFVLFVLYVPEGLVALPARIGEHFDVDFDGSAEESEVSD